MDKTNIIVISIIALINIIVIIGFILIDKWEKN